MRLALLRTRITDQLAALAGHREVEKDNRHALPAEVVGLSSNFCESLQEAPFMGGFEVAGTIQRPALRTLKSSPGQGVLALKGPTEQYRAPPPLTRGKT